MQNQQSAQIESVSQSKQKHKFFERFLTNDLDILNKELHERYIKIQNAEIVGVTPVTDKELWVASNSVSTMKWRQYNVFQFHSDGLYNLYKAIGDMTREACEYYDLDFEEQKYMLQGWFNITHKGKGKLDWHDHGPMGAPNFHGYYSVSAEPSITYYKVFDKNVENHNINNRAILSEMGHPHAMADWDWEGPRITVAYDIIPLADLQKFAIAVEAVNDKYNKLLDVSSKTAQSNKQTGALAKDIFKFEKQQAAIQKNVIANIENQNSLKEKQIAQIKKEADARKRALQDQQQIEDVKLQIQQEQLNYQNALAAGDMSSAAQAQINIQRLVGQQQLKSAENAIDDAAQKQIDALQAQIDVLNKKAGVASSSEKQPAQSPLRPMYEGIQAVYKDLAVGNISEEEAVTRFNDIVRKLEGTKGGQKYLKDLGVSGSVNNITREDGQRSVGKIDMSQSAGKQMLDAVTKGSNDIAIEQLKVLREIRDKIDRTTYTPPPSTTPKGTGTGTTPGQVPSAGGSQASGTVENYTTTATSIKTAAIKLLMNNTSLGSVNYSQESAKIIPYGMFVDLIMKMHNLHYKMHNLYQQHLMSLNLVH
jgi:hypothetical protein